MAKDVLGVSATTATLYGAVIAGLFTLIGVWGTQVLEDRRRRRGELSREVRAWTGGSVGSVGETRQFEVRFFNDRDVNIALWDVQVAYYRDDELIDTITPYPAGAVRAEAEPIDLESRKSVYLSLELGAGSEELPPLKSADKLEFVATMKPSGERLSKSLPTWDPLVPA